MLLDKFLFEIIFMFLKKFFFRFKYVYSNSNIVMFMHKILFEFQNCYSNFILIFILIEIFCLNVSPKTKKTSCLVSGIGRVKISSSLTRPHSRMCIRIYIFCFKHKNRTHRNKKQKKLIKNIKK